MASKFGVRNSKVKAQSPTAAGVSLNLPGRQPQTESGPLTVKLLLPLTALALILGPAQAAAANIFQAVTDQTTYDAGSEVKIRINASSPSSGAPLRLVASVRYRGSGNGPSPAPAAQTVLFTGDKPPTGYISLWKIPADASTGRYDVDLEVTDPESGRAREGQARVASFAVHRQLVRINRIELDKTFYTSGDPVSVEVNLSNLSGGPLRGLRVEFSDRYWPWIGPTGGSTDLHIVSLARGLTLPAHA